MQLHQLQPTHPHKRGKIRVGRGGKRGTTSGRGTKGQRSRAGRRIRPGERDFIQRLPKLRGVKNKPVTEESFIVNIRDLGKVSGTIINRETLIRAGLVPARGRNRVKILGKGDLSTAFTVEKILVSRGALKKIEHAGGKVTS